MTPYGEFKELNKLTPRRINTQSQLLNEERRLQELAMKQVENYPKTDATILVVPIVVEVEKVVEKIVEVKKEEDTPWWFTLLISLIVLSLLIGLPLVLVSVVITEIAAAIAFICLVLILVLAGFASGKEMEKK